VLYSMPSVTKICPRILPIKYVFYQRLHLYGRLVPVRVMKAYGRGGVTPLFWTLALYLLKWSDSRFGRIVPRKAPSAPIDQKTGCTTELV